MQQMYNYVIMQDKLSERIKALGTAEKDIVTTNHLGQLEMWARLLDEVGANLHVLDSIGHSDSNYTQSKQQFETNILNSLANLNLANDPNSYQNLKNNISGYRQYFSLLVDMKTKILAINNDLTDLEAIKRANSEAKKRKDELEKSFSDYSQKQAEESTRTLAKYFEVRLKDLKHKDNMLTNPKYWANKRSQWLGILMFTVFALAALQFLMIRSELSLGYEWQILLLKVTVIAILYLQYHFATKNYHIYAELVAKYEHRNVISKTMTDFSEAAYQDQILREAVLSNASRTLFSDIDSGHQKNADKDSTVFENIINQIPKNS